MQMKTSPTKTFFRGCVSLSNKIPVASLPQMSHSIDMVNDLLKWKALDSY